MLSGGNVPATAHPTLLSIWDCDPGKGYSDSQCLSSSHYPRITIRIRNLTLLSHRLLIIDYYFTHLHQKCKAFFDFYIEKQLLPSTAALI